MGLAEADVPVEEQGVVGGARVLGDADAGGVGEAVAGPDDEGVEGVVGVELDVAGGQEAPGRRRGRLLGGLLGLGRGGRAARRGPFGIDQVLDASWAPEGVLDGAGDHLAVVIDQPRAREVVVHCDGDAQLVRLGQGRAPEPRVVRR